MNKQFANCYNSSNVQWRQWKNIEELKPCPFCGGEARFGHDFQIGLFISCTKCSVRIGHCIKEKQYLISAWNSRV
jgi:Lar family restriction alleviation protein